MLPLITPFGIDVKKLPVSASVINEPDKLPNVFHLVSFEDVYVSNTDELKNGVTTAKEEVVAYPKLDIC